MFADASAMDRVGERYGAFGGWGIAAEKFEVLLVFNGLDVDRSLACQHLCQYQGWVTWEGEMELAGMEFIFWLIGVGIAEMLA